MNSDKKRIVVIGGGFGGIKLIQALRNTGYEIVLVDKNNYHTFQPLLYQVASTGLGADSIGYPFRRIFRNYKKFKYCFSEVLQIIPESNEIITQTEKINYDILVIATGSSANFFNNKNIEREAMPLKTITDALNLRSFILQNFESASKLKDVDEIKRCLNFVIVGGGPTGVELAGALADFKKYIVPKDYPEINPELIKINLLEGLGVLLNGMSEVSSKKTFDYLKSMGVNVMLNTLVSDYDGSEVKLNNGKIIKTKSFIWSAGVKGALIEGIKNESVTGGRYIVDEFNKIKDYENIYAIGDVALMMNSEFPKGHAMVATVAVQQAENLANNLIAKNELIKFKYNNKGSMATVGRNKAVVDLPKFKFQGFFAWLFWIFVHVMLLVGFRNRFVVFFDWFWSYVSYSNSFGLIIRPFRKDLY